MMRHSAGFGNGAQAFQPAVPKRRQANKKTAPGQGAVRRNGAQALPHGIILSAIGGGSPERTRNACIPAALIPFADGLFCRRLKRLESIIQNDTNP